MPAGNQKSDFHWEWLLCKLKGGRGTGRRKGAQGGCNDIAKRKEEVWKWHRGSKSAVQPCDASVVVGINDQIK